MTDQNSDRNSKNDRDLGVDFGEINGELEAVDYPIRAEELIERHGDATLEMEGGSQTLAEILEPVSDQEFESIEQAHQTIVGFVDRNAVGRPRYSDRDPPGMGEEAESEEESF